MNVTSVVHTTQEVLTSPPPREKHEFRLPAGHKRHAVATCMLLVASLCFLIMADSIYVVCVTILLFS